MAPVLALFFSRGVGLNVWLERGLLDREQALYERQLSIGAISSVLFITYGPDDAKLAKQLHAEARLHPQIEVIAPPGWARGQMGQLFYSLILPWLCRNPLRRAHLYKTNQMDGGWAAAIASKLHRRPLIARSGYTISRFCQQQGRPRVVCAAYRALERIAYARASVATVTSLEDAAYVARLHHPRRLRLVTNFIDVERFSPADVPRHDRRVVTVGRMEPQKNFEALIEAAAVAGFGVDIIGDGPLRQELAALAVARGVDVGFLGRVPNRELPLIFSGYRYFALVSHFEGMPKALLEAMSCGLCCIGTEVPGIREVLRDGVTGIVSNLTTAASLADALGRASSSDWRMLGAAARSYVKRKHALRRVAEADARVLLEALNSVSSSQRRIAQSVPSIDVETPLVSVLMAVHNGEAHVEEALGSICSQTYEHIEVIVVNDGSTDGTASILGRWCTRDARVRVISQANQGLTRSLNLAIARSRGRYVARLDADDVAAPDRLAKQVAYLDHNLAIALVGSAYNEIDNHGRPLGPQRAALVRGTEALRRALRRGNPFCHSSVMLRRAWLVRNGGYDESFRFAQDAGLWVKLLRHHHADNLPDALVSRRMREGMITVRNRRAQRWHALRARICALRWFSGPVSDWIWLLVDFGKIIAPSRASVRAWWQK